MKVEAYLYYDGRCEEALEFYRTALNAKVTSTMRFKDCPDPQMRHPGNDEKIMHASFRIGETTVMASDGHSQGAANFKGFSLALSLPTAAETRQMFAALADGGNVQMPLAKTFFSECFGMVTDRFGVLWTLLVA